MIESFMRVYVHVLKQTLFIIHPYCAVLGDDTIIIIIIFRKGMMETKKNDYFKYVISAL